MPLLSIRSFYEEESDPEADGRELLPAVDLPPLGEEHRPALDRLIEWGKERKELSELMAYAEPASGSSGDALEAIVQKFPVTNRTRRVHVPRELVDRYAGGNPRDLKFGVQDIESDDQLKKLEGQIEGMRKYFPGIALCTMTDNRSGKKTALIMGIETHAYNSLVKAHKKKEQLNGAVRTACKELNVPEEWVDRKIEQTNTTTRPRVRDQQAPPPPKKKTGRGQG